MGEVKVYLDHLIPRENLRYARPGYTGDDPATDPEKLHLSSLLPDYPYSQATRLRKPDFQRATASWSPEECVALLDSIVKRQVVPGIILWSSPDGPHTFILDGAHRVSVVLAWFLDDWGDRVSIEDLIDHELVEARREAARLVREMVRTRIGAFKDYKAAGDEQERLDDEGMAPSVEMAPLAWQRARFYNDLIKHRVFFRTQYVSGDYDIAERSFLAINRSGSQLTRWETIIVENRNSSFARVVMATANISSVEHYWSSRIGLSEDVEDATTRIPVIQTSINQIHSMLFRPQYTSHIRQLRQPLLVVDGIDKKPQWIAELFTVIESRRGSSGNTDELMKLDTNSSPETIVQNGERVVRNVLEALNHLIGPATNPKSLAIVPALYLYNEKGKYVRSLLFGIIFWLLSGDEKEILSRKQIYSAFRGLFERFLVDKDVLLLTRRTGSGTDIIIPTAQYYQNLLQLLIDHKGDIEADAFKDAYDQLVATLVPGSKRERSTALREGRSRAFTQAQRSTEVLKQLLGGAPHCGICDGLYDPSASELLQHDHIEMHSQGGPTLGDNQRLTHPFCNNNRKVIEEIQQNARSVHLPLFTADMASGADRPVQLRLFGDDVYEKP